MAVRAAGQRVPSQEAIEVFAASGRRIGVRPRAEVHRAGSWHRAVHVWVLRETGELLLQLRAADKDTAPGRWDLSAAEHLRPGEAWRSGAMRGLAEELGLRVAAGRLRQIRAPTRFVLADRARRLLDREWHVTWLLAVTRPRILVDPGEVQAVRWSSVADLDLQLARHPDRFTPWLCAEWPGVEAALRRASSLAQDARCMAANSASRSR